MLNKFVTKYYKYFTPHLHNVSTLLYIRRYFCEDPNAMSW